MVPASMIPSPYLLFLGDADSPVMAKTAFGLRDWAPERCLSQWRRSGPISLGLPDRRPAEAFAAGARTLVIGVAPVGGRLPDEWIPLLVEALEAGLDLAAGLHDRLNRHPVLAEAAARLGRRLHDVREAGVAFPVGTGRKRSGRRLLTVGTDCAVGKKYAALAITRALKDRGVDASFRATGQTGILIAGQGVPIDAVVSDFVAGAAETLSPDAAPEHWDVIEGQGALMHPGYAGVTLGLIHGSQPDALVLCHEPGRAELDGFPGYAPPEPVEAMPAYLQAARLTNPQVRFVALALNTSALPEAQAMTLLAEAGARCGLIAFDPLRTGAGAVAEALASWR
jgi:uncharacterized NAD-dependent epimerase/dehydratase family protein